MEKIAFIGLGIMGRPMAQNLVKAGMEVFVYGHNKKVIDELVLEGAKAASSEAMAAENATISIVMVQDSPQSKEAVLGESAGVIKGAKAGHLVIDMSSIAPLESKKIAKMCEEKGVSFLDAPVSGGEPGAVNGELAIMVGGKDEDFNRAKPVFDVLGKSAILCGPVGAGGTTKLANQVVVAGNIYALAEALFLAKQSGLDLNKVYEAIKGGLAGSNVMNAKSKMMIESNFKPGFRVELHLKDIKNATKTSSALGLNLQLTKKLESILESLVNKGSGALDHSAILEAVKDA